MDEQYEKLISDHWSEMAKKTTPFHWSDSSIVMEYINKCISGNPNIGWLEYACKKYLIKGVSGVDRGLSIGCGSGALERQCRKMNACKTMDAFDIAQGAIDEAKRLAIQENIKGINYDVKNLEKISLPPNAYDVVFASSAVHHIKDLERFFENIKSTLKPEGLFFMLEYVGPSQFQFSQKVVSIINEILNILPPFYRKLSSDNTKTKDFFVVTPLDYMNKNDPSEAVRSDEIVPLLPTYFTVIEKKGYGGTLLHMLLQDIIANFIDSSYKDTTILKLLILLESILIREKVLESDFAFIVVRNKNVNKLCS